MRTKSPRGDAENTKDATPSARKPRGRPRQIPLEEQRERILVAATEVFVAEGFGGTTSERIAEIAGVGRPTVYQMFGSKNDVFIAAVDRALTRMLDHIRRSLATTAHLRGRKQATANIAAYFDLVTTEPHTFRMLLLADTSGDNTTRDAARAIRQRLKSAIANYIRSTWEGFGDLEPRDAEFGATIIAAAVETAAVQHMENPDRSTAEAVQFTADFVWSGIYDLAVGHDIPLGRRAAKPKSRQEIP